MSEEQFRDSFLLFFSSKWLWKLKISLNVFVKNEGQNSQVRNEKKDAKKVYLRSVAMPSVMSLYFMEPSGSLKHCLHFIYMIACSVDIEKAPKEQKIRALSYGTTRAKSMNDFLHSRAAQIFWVSFSNLQTEVLPEM